MLIIDENIPFTVREPEPALLNSEKVEHIPRDSPSLQNDYSSP